MLTSCLCKDALNNKEKKAKLILAQDFQANFKNVFLSLMNMKDCHKTRKNPGFATIFFILLLKSTI